MIIFCLYVYCPHCWVFFKWLFISHVLMLWIFLSTAVGAYCRFSNVLFLLSSSSAILFLVLSLVCEFCKRSLKNQVVGLFFCFLMLFLLFCLSTIGCATYDFGNLLKFSLWPDISLPSFCKMFSGYLKRCIMLLT